MSDLEDIGRKAVAFVTSRAARMEARRTRNRAAGDWLDENGPEARYDPESDHEQGFSHGFLLATRDAQRAYATALSAEKSARQKLYAAVKKHVKASAL